MDYATPVSIFKLIDGIYKIEEVWLKPGIVVNIHPEASQEIFFCTYDFKRVIFIDGVNFDHRNRSLKAPKLNQTFKLEVREVVLM